LQAIKRIAEVMLKNKSASGEIDLSNVARRVLASQAAITTLAAIAFTLMGGLQVGAAALYGGLVALVSTWLLKRRVSRVTEAAGISHGKSMMLIYVGVAQRFLLVLVLLALALSVLKLNPLACIVGFGLSQLGYVISRVLQKG
jgi:ATP synthase protein I